MFLLDGKPLAPDSPFTTSNGTQYPANWLRLSTLEEKEAIGITEVPDPPTWDQRFYWGYDQDGQLIPKDHAGLVTLWENQTKNTANTLLAPTDWMVVREADNGTACPADTKSWRQLIRISCETKVANVGATTTTDELAAYITGSDYPVWPAQEDINAPYASWTQSLETGKWTAPIPYPTVDENGELVTELYEWDETNQRWIKVPKKPVVE
jgi:hypothetical protein